MILQKLPLHVKAEPLINTLLDYEAGVSSIEVVFNGSFQRNYLNDISHIQVKSKNTTGEPSLYVHLNRDGIYDKLPEGFFHDIDRFVKLDSSGSQKTFKEEYEKQKNEIEYSRKFFHPFDNLFFHLSLSIDKKYSDLTKNAQQTVYELFFDGKKRFKLSDKHLNKVVSFLPYLSTIRTNFTTLQFFISYLYEATVTIEQIESIESNCSIYHQFNVLNQSILGKDFYCGNHFFDFSIKWKIKITTKESSLRRLIENSEFIQLNDFLKSYVIPLGIESTIQFQTYTLSNLVLQKDAMSAKRQYLGINVTI